MDAGAPQRFRGWIELVAAIESLRGKTSVGGDEGLAALPGVSGASI